MITTSASVVVAACAFLAPMPACAQTASERPVRIVVASAPGSPADEQIRALVAFMSGSLGRALIVDNRGTGRGVPASETVARADPSGNTLLLGSSVTHAANPVLNEGLSYDPTRDFVPVTQIARTGMIVAGHRSLPGSSVPALAKHARSAPVPLKLGSHDIVEQAAGQALGRLLGFNLQPVMHQSSLPAMLALTSGAVDLSLLTPYAARPHVHGGRLKAFGITGFERSSALPEIATLAEQGIEGYDLPCWDGLFAPAGTPAEVVSAIHRSAAHALGTQSVRGLYLELGITPVGNTPAEFAAILTQDIAAFRRIAARSVAAAK